MKILKKVSIILVTIILGSMLGLIGICKTDKYEGFVITSGSMEPTLSVNEFLLVGKAEEYNNGDIISFKNEGEDITTHRIVEVTEEGYITRGDANNSNDTEIVKKENIIGKKFLSLPLLGCIYMLITSISFNVYVFLGLGALAVLTFLIVYEWLDKKEKEEKEEKHEKEERKERKEK